MEFSEYVNTSGVVVHRGDRSFKIFEDYQPDNGVKRTFLDNNAMIAIAIVKQFRDSVCSYSFWNTGELFRKLFLTEIGEKDTKNKGSC